MPGRMGGKQVTVKNIWVYKVDPARNLIWVKGQVSGSLYILGLNLKAISCSINVLPPRYSVHKV